MITWTVVSDLVAVGHSPRGFTATLVCARIPVDLVVLLAAMIPAPGELFSDRGPTPAIERAGTRTSSYDARREQVRALPKCDVQCHATGSP